MTPEQPLRSLTIIWGVPGTGKSHFARWMAQHKGFRHAETEVVLNAVDQALAWAEQGQPVVLEWGLFVQRDTIEIVRQWQKGGADLWWFDGDPRAAAFQAWKLENRKRGRPYTDDLWYRMVGRINENWLLVQDLFGSARILYTVRTGPTHLTEDAIYKLMAERRGKE